MFFGKKPQTPTNNVPQPAAETTAAQPAKSPPATAVAGQGAAAGAGSAPVLSPEEAKKRAMTAKQIAASFGEIVMLLMRSPTERQHTLHDLEWMIAPALVRGQFAVADAQSRETGAVMPVGAILWAFVSAEVDKRLSAQSLEAPRLAPAEWRSGDIPWVILTAGDPKVLGGLLQQLAKTVFKDRPAKIRVKGPDGKLVVGRLELTPEAAGHG